MSSLSALLHSLVPSHAAPPAPQGDRERTVAAEARPGPKGRKPFVPAGPRYVVRAPNAKEAAVVLKGSILLDARVWRVTSEADDSITIELQPGLPRD